MDVVWLWEMLLPMLWLVAERQDTTLPFLQSVLVGVAKENSLLSTPPPPHGSETQLTLGALTRGGSTLCVESKRESI
jgi:hypothetical protein